MGSVVCKHIGGLMLELKTLNPDTPMEPAKDDEPHPGSAAAEADAVDKHFRGTLLDRFGKEPKSMPLFFSTQELSNICISLF